MGAIKVGPNKDIGAGRFTSDEFILSGIINQGSWHRELGQAPVFQLAPRYTLPTPPVPTDKAQVDIWLRAHSVEPGVGTTAQREKAIHKLWANRAVIEARSGNDSHAINELLDNFPRVLSGATRKHMPKVDAEFQQLDNELRNNYRAHSLHGPYRVDYDAGKNVRIVPVQSVLTDSEVLQADSLIENFNNFTRLRERFSATAAVTSIMSRLGQSMREIKTENQDFYLKLRDYVSPAAEGGMFATLTPEERVRFLVFMDRPSAYAVPARQKSVLNSKTEGEVSTRALHMDLIALKNLIRNFPDEALLPALARKINARISGRDTDLA